MVNRRKLFTLIFFLFFACSGLLTAQEHKFKQKLSWVADKNAFDYKVEIRGVDSGYKSLLEATETSVEVSLPAGEYKYRVYAYDFLGRQASVSGWRNFTVLKAVSPKIEKTEKEVVPVKGDDKISIPVDVKSIEEDSTVVLINTETKKEVKGKLEVKTIDDKTIVASEAVFPPVEEGNWVMKVTNPSGLSTESEQIVVDAHKTKAQLAAEKKAEEDRIAAEKKAEEDRIAAEKKAEEDKLAAERKAEEERLAAERKAEEDKLAAERKAEEERLAAERKAEEERLAAEKKAEEERKAEEKLAKKEEKKNKPAKDITFLLGGGVDYNQLYGGQLFKDISNSNSEGLSTVLPALDFRMGWLPFKSSGWKSGFEFAATADFAFAGNDYVFVIYPTEIFQLNFVLQRKIVQDHFYWALKTGPSIYLMETLVNYQQTTTRVPENAAIGGFGVQCGTSLVIIPKRSYELEIGVDYNNLFVPESITGTIHGYLVMGVRL